MEDNYKIYNLVQLAGNAIVTNPVFVKAVEQVRLSYAFNDFLAENPYDSTIRASHPRLQFGK